MLKAKLMVVENEMIVELVEKCGWNELATMEQVIEMVCEGFSIPEGGVITECLDGFLQVDEEDGEIIELPRVVKEFKLDTMFNFGFASGEYGIISGRELENMLLADKSIELTSKDIASFEDCEWLVCAGSALIDDGTYLISDGLLEVIDGELEHIELKLEAI